MNTSGLSANTKGAMWMVLSMAAFALEDSLIKHLSVVMPLSQIMLFFGLGGALGFALLAKYRQLKLFLPQVLGKAMLVRMGFEVTGRLFYFIAIVLIPLSTATVILQATPLVVTAAVAVVFGERVLLRSWLAIVVGLGGVLLIVQPAADDFSALSLLAVVGMLGFAGRDLASRAAPAAINTTLLGFYGFLAVVVAGLIFSWWQGAAFVAFHLAVLGYLGAAIVVGIGAYISLMKAMRTGDVSVVTPYRYSRLLFGVALGVWVFAEPVSQSMLLGAGLIVLAGFLLMSQKQRH